MKRSDLKWRLDIMSRDMKRTRGGIPMDHGENQHQFLSMDVKWHFERTNQ